MYADREELKSVKLKHEGTEWYLDLLYVYENKTGIYELHIPHVILPFSDDRMPLIHNSGDFNDKPHIQFGIYELPLVQAKTKHMENGEYFYTIKTLEEKCQEMTLEEVGL